MKYVLCFLFSCAFFQGFSQNYFDILNVSYSNTPSNEFETSEAASTVEELGLKLNVPIVIDKQTTFLTGVFANKTTLKLDANMPSSKLNVLGLTLGLNKVFNDKWSSTFMILTKIASDEIKITNDNMQLGAVALFTNTKRPDLKFKYGLYANAEKFGLFIVPIFGVYYVSTNKKLEVNLKLPITGDVNYELNKKTWIGCTFDGMSSTYNLNNQNYSQNGAYVAKTSNELSSYLRFKLSTSIYINAKAGYTLGRNFKVYDSNDKIDLGLSSFSFGDDRTQLNESFKNGAIFKVELVYRLHFNK